MIRKLRIKCCAINFKDILGILEIAYTSIDVSCTIIQFIKIKLNICEFVPEINKLSFQYEVELNIFSIIGNKLIYQKSGATIDLNSTY